MFFIQLNCQCLDSLLKFAFLPLEVAEAGRFNHVSITTCWKKTAQTSIENCWWSWCTSMLSLIILVNRLLKLDYHLSALLCTYLCSQYLNDLCSCNFIDCLFLCIKELTYKITAVEIRLEMSKGSSNPISIKMHLQASQCYIHHYSHN